MVAVAIQQQETKMFDTYTDCVLGAVVLVLAIIGLAAMVATWIF